MSGGSAARQAWLVAVREMRERGRSVGFRVSVLVMIAGVVAAILIPAWLANGSGTKDIGVAGTVPAGLPAVIQAQGDAAGITTRIHRYASVTAGEQAVRNGDADVLVVDARRLEWRRQADQQVRAVVTSAIQLLAVRERAASAGINPDTATALLAPVPVREAVLGSVAGRGSGDETAAMVMTIVLFVSLTSYGGLVLAGVVEEKSSRVVEVLLARMPARSLLAGKVAGIGLLGLAQIAVTAVAALAATAAVRSAAVPAVSSGVLAWMVAWFLLGYALYAMVYGALGSLASRAEDAQGAAAPVTTLLVAAYFLSFLALGSPDGTAARIASLVPVTAPLAMPSRIAMGAAAWWEPPAAALLTLAAIAALLRLAGRVYAGAVLHGGPSLKLRDAWRLTGTRQAHALTGREGHQAGTRKIAGWRASAALLGVGAALGALAAVLAGDVIIGVAAGAGCYAIATRIARQRGGAPSAGHHHRQD